MGRVSAVGLLFIMLHLLQRCSGTDVRMKVIDENMFDVGSVAKSTESEVVASDDGQNATDRDSSEELLANENQLETSGDISSPATTGTEGPDDNSTANSTEGVPIINGVNIGEAVVGDVDSNYGEDDVDLPVTTERKEVGTNPTVPNTDGSSPTTSGTESPVSDTQSDPQSTNEEDGKIVDTVGDKSPPKADVAAGATFGSVIRNIEQHLHGFNFSAIKSFNTSSLDAVVDDIKKNYNEGKARETIDSNDNDGETTYESTKTDESVGTPEATQTASTDAQSTANDTTDKTTTESYSEYTEVQLLAEDMDLKDLKQVSGILNQNDPHLVPVPVTDVSNTNTMQPSTPSTDISNSEPTTGSVGDASEGQKPSNGDSYGTESTPPPSSNTPTVCMGCDDTNDRPTSADESVQMAEGTIAPTSSPATGGRMEIELLAADLDDPSMAGIEPPGNSAHQEPVQAEGSSSLPPQTSTSAGDIGLSTTTQYSTDEKGSGTVYPTPSSTTIDPAQKLIPDTEDTAQPIASGGQILKHVINLPLDGIVQIIVPNAGDAKQRHPSIPSDTLPDPAVGTQDGTPKEIIELLADDFTLHEDREPSYSVDEDSYGDRDLGMTTYEPYFTSATYAPTSQPTSPVAKCPFSIKTPDSRRAKDEQGEQPHTGYHGHEPPYYDLDPFCLTRHHILIPVMPVVFPQWCFAPDTPDFMCPGYDLGFHIAFAHETARDMYYRCVYGQAVLLRCPNLHHWDDTRQMCALMTDFSHQQPQRHRQRLYDHAERHPHCQHCRRNFLIPQDVDPTAQCSDRMLLACNTDGTLSVYECPAFYFYDRRIQLRWYADLERCDYPAGDDGPWQR